MRSAILLTAAAVISATADLLCEVTPWHTHTCPTTVSWVEQFSKPITVEAAAGGPEQLWLNYGSSPDTMVVGWLTSNMSAGSVVRYGLSPGQYTGTASGRGIFYTYSAKYTSGLIHHVNVTGLLANTKYYYSCGSDSAWSAEYSFTSNPGVGPAIPHTIAFVGDIGENSNANSTITHLLAAVKNIDSVVINGDISYASGCEANGCADWDAFQRMATPLAAIRPWAVNIGNHETYDVSNGAVAISTKYRFAGMPTPTDYKSDGCFYFSYEAGPTHVISVSSFYPTESAPDFSDNSPITVWLKSDLAKVDRKKTPWLLVSIHAPIYNSNTEHQGDGEPLRKAFEPLFIAAGVDAIFTGHVHSYERTFPTNNGKVDNVKGITNFNIGDAGADLYTSWLAQPAWSAFRSATFGHGLFQIFNSTTAEWSWHEHESNGSEKVRDTVIITCKASAM